MYDLNNPDTLEQLELLTGSKTAALKLFESATLIHKITKATHFHVRFYNNDWVCMFNNISQDMINGMKYSS